MSGAPFKMKGWSPFTKKKKTESKKGDQPEAPGWKQYTQVKNKPITPSTTKKEYIGDKFKHSRYVSEAIKKGGWKGYLKAIYKNPTSVPGVFVESIKRGYESIKEGYSYEKMKKKKIKYKNGI